MTLEMHATIAASERDGHVEQVPAHGDGCGRASASAQDLLARLNAMQRMAGAIRFAVFTCSSACGVSGGGLSRVLGAEAGEGIRAASPAGRLLLAHVERSSLPLVWDGTAGEKAKAAADSRRNLARTVLPDTGMAGVAFPVRLGAIGNGVVVFEGERLNLAAGLLFILHRMAYRVMADLFRQEMSRAAPRQSLSERELECLQWAGDGCRSEAIADKLGLSVHTVNAYLGSATAKLDSVNRIQAIAKAIRLGFIA